MKAEAQKIPQLVPWWGPFRRHWNVPQWASGCSHFGLAPSYNRSLPIPHHSSEA